MFRAIRRAWTNYLASIPRSEVIDSIPPSQWDSAEHLPTVSKAKRKAFVELLSAVYAHLPAEKGAVLVAAGTKHLTRGDDIDSALRNALIGDNGEEENSSQLGFIACDWKGIDEVKWQAEELSRAHGLTESWSGQAATLDSAIEDLAIWLAARHLQLFSFSVGDSIVAFAVANSLSPAVAGNLKQLKISFVVRGEA
jgi:hypothetical protein